MSISISFFWRSTRPMPVSPCFAEGKQDETKPLKKNFFIPPREPYSLINPYVTTTREPDRAMMSSRSTSFKIYEPGMIVLKRYISIEDQVDIVNKCEEWGKGPAGFRCPRDQNGEKLPLDIMCFGRNWDPVTKYEERYISDGCESPPPPPPPQQLISLAETAVQDAQAHGCGLPSMHPDICLVSFLPTSYSGQGLHLHQDCDESPESLRRGLPVVSITIGNTVAFRYGQTKKELKGFYLSSGDVLIFGGESRLIYHEVCDVLICTGAPELFHETGLLSGSLNLTLKQF